LRGGRYLQSVPATDGRLSLAVIETQGIPRRIEHAEGKARGAGRRRQIENLNEPAIGFLIAGGPRGLRKD